MRLHLPALLVAFFVSLPCQNLPSSPPSPAVAPSHFLDLHSPSHPKAATMSAKFASAIGHGEAVELTDRTAPHSGEGKEVRYTVQDAGSGSGSDQEVLEEQDGTLRATKSSHEDIVGMKRMGKDQQLVRKFRQLSITSFVALATATWEIGLFIISPALIDGGRAGLLWSALWCWIGFAPIYLSMVCRTPFRRDVDRELTVRRLRWLAWPRSLEHSIIGSASSLLVSTISQR